MSTSWASRRDLPAAVDGYGPVAPFAGAFAVRPDGRRHAPSLRSVRPGERKVVPGLRELFRLVGVEDGMTLSFHHHLRDGDGVVNAVLATAAELGLRDLRVALSSVSPCTPRWSSTCGRGSWAPSTPTTWSDPSRGRSREAP